MGVTLITPQGSNFIKDFPGQNAANLNSIDDYAGPCLITHPLQTFTPGLSASVTSPNLGVGGSSIAYYYKIFDQIYVWGEFRFGSSGISAGSGIYTVTLPFVMSNQTGTTIVGTGLVHDNDSNAGRVPVLVRANPFSNIQLDFLVRTNSGLANRELRDSGYITWAVNDGLSWHAKFKRQ